jgi:hypothetical protein
MLGLSRPEDPVGGLNQLVTSSIGVIAVALAIACVVLIVAVVVLARRTASLDRRLDGLTRGADGVSLESVLSSHLAQVHEVARDVDALEARSAVLEQTQRRTFQRMGLVRFNPFEDTGGNQSFVLALLDQRGDGFIVSSLHSRTGTRIYGKAITGGTSDAALSSEEAEALRLALASGTGSAKAG